MTAPTRQDALPENLSAAFMTGKLLSAKAPLANGNTVAHELAHLVFDSAVRGEANSAGHIDHWNEVNVLAASGKPDNSVLRKRLTRALVLSGRLDDNRFTAPVTTP